MKTSSLGRAIRHWVSAALAGAFLALTASHCNDVTGPRTTAPTPTPVPAPTLTSVTVRGPAQRGSKIDFAGTGFDTTSRFSLHRSQSPDFPRIDLINPRAIQSAVVEVEVPQTIGFGGHYDEACVATRAGIACRPALFDLSRG